MTRGALLDERMAARIAESPYSLIVHFPVVRQVATGSSPGTAPISPLTRPGPTAAFELTPGTPSAAPVTMKCLWYSAYGGSASSSIRNEWDRGFSAWVAGADALARVRTVDAGVAEGESYGTSVFSRCEAVEFEDKRYRVIGVYPVTAGWKRPATLHVWLAGAVA